MVNCSISVHRVAYIAVNAVKTFVLSLKNKFKCNYFTDFSFQSNFHDLHIIAHLSVYILLKKEHSCSHVAE